MQFKGFFLTVFVVSVFGLAVLVATNSASAQNRYQMANVAGSAAATGSCTGSCGSACGGQCGGQCGQSSCGCAGR